MLKTESFIHREIMVCFNVVSLAAEKGILVSVLSADTRDLSGQCYGSMLLKLPRDTEQAKQAAAYMRSQNGVTVEEVTGE